MHGIIPSRCCVAAFVTIAFLLGATAAAHHSGVGFNEDADLRLQGTVMSFDWVNPHVYIELAIDDADGQRELWDIEAESPAAISLLGWSAESLVPGERITVEARPARRSGRQVALGVAVIKADGTQLRLQRDRGERQPGSAVPANSLSGRWFWEGGPIIGRFLAPAEAFELTVAGAAAVAGYDDSDNPSQNCVSEPIPYVMVFPSLKSIVVEPERIVIRESLGVEREIRMNVESHDGIAYSDTGHSIGYWEDDVLVIDTARFTEHRRGNAWGLPSGRDKHLVERLSLSADRTTLSYTFMLEDPEYLAEPVNGALVLTHRPDLPFVMEPCDLDSARRYLD